MYEYRAFIRLRQYYVAFNAAACGAGVGKEKRTGGGGGGFGVMVGKTS